ncbi:MAG: hypothetical protein IJC72_00235 [Clostridia bacterium]|nr:hypothetical protein [Clostridia bacterium]
MNGLGRNSEKESKKQPLLTSETFGVVLILFTTLALVCLITRDAVFSLPGKAVNAFLLGCFGVFAYAVLAWFVLLGIKLITGKKTGISIKRIVLFTLAFVLAAVISQIATTSGSTKLGFSEYLSISYAMGDGGIETASAGGMFAGILAYVFSSLLTEVGSYVVLGICFAVSVFFLVRDIFVSREKTGRGRDKFRSSFVKKEPEVEQLPKDVIIEGEKPYPVENVVATPQPAQNAGKQRLFVSNPEQFAFRTKREVAREKNDAHIKLGFSEHGLGVVSPDGPTTFNNNELQSKLDYIKTPVAINVEKISARPTPPPISQPVVRDNNVTVSDYVTRRQEPQAQETATIPHLEHDGGKIDGDDVGARAEMFRRKYASNLDEEKPTRSPSVETFVQPPQQPISMENVEAKNTGDFLPPLISEEDNTVEETSAKAETVQSEEPSVSRVLGSDRVRNILMGDSQPNEEEKVVGAQENKEDVAFTSRVEADDNLGARRRLSFEPEKTKVEKVEQLKINEKPKPPINRKYHRPPLDLLETYALPMDAPQDDHDKRLTIIQRTLEEFKINVVPQGYVQGPSVTRYEVTMPAGVPISRVLSCSENLQMRLAVKEGVRIEAPIPGKDMVGVEVANTSRTPVGLKEIMQGIAKSGKGGSLVFAVGKDVVGNAIFDDLAKGPHYLVAGATGSGKSVALHIMIVSLLMRYSPEELKIVLVDPKLSEFNKYEHLPHLLVDEIVSDSKRAVTLLQWAYEETTRRNEMFAETAGMVSNIDEYNAQIANETTPKLPRIVFFIDELADLMEAQKKELEEKIRRIAAKSRSAGIHLVLATQRPSVDVITGTIKNNLPSRIALKLMGFNDSQTILNKGGAEKLLGNGDMLYQNSKMSDAERYQGAFITNREIMNVVNYIKENNKSYFDDDIVSYLEENSKESQEEPVSGGDESGANEKNDELFLQALWLAVSTKTISISQLQRRFQIGYARAGGLVDKMERMKFVSGNEGSKARRVLLDKEGYESRFGPAPDDSY